MNTRPTSRILAMLGAALVAGLTLAAPSSAAAAPANIDPNAERSLTLTKLSAPTEAGYTGNHGEPITDTPTGSVPLEGVTLRIQQVTSYGGEPVDLLRTEGWENIAQLLEGDRQFDPGAAGTTLTSGSEKVTGTDGTATWSGDELPLGLYWVTETDPGEHEIAQPVVPFLITVPAPTDEAGVWRYDVHAYPKNTIISGSKEVDTSMAEAIGDQLRWTVTGTIPANPSTGVELDLFQIVDRLPAGVVWDPATADVLVEHQELGADEPTPLQDGDHYTVTATGDPDEEVVTLTLTEEGRRIVQAAIGRAGGDVRFSFNTKVTSLGNAGVFTNTADVIVNQAVVPLEATTHFGPLRIVKIADGNEQARLDDAEFQVFATIEEAEAANEAVAARETPIGAIEVEVDGERVSTFVTHSTAPGAPASEEGSVLIPGLITAEGGRQYFIVETKAPAGYVRANNVFEATVMPEGEPTGASVVTVSNPTAAGLSLASTGTMPPVLLQLAGAGLVVVGIAGLISSRVARKRRMKSGAGD